MAIEVLNAIDDPRLLLGVVEVCEGDVREASAALKARAAALAQRLAGWELPDEKRRAVRSLLKSGGYSPTGRGKPAHEFLLADLTERGAFNHINNVVDANNVISLEALLAVSVFDAGRLTAPVTVRHGADGEGYVFNPSGQQLDVKRMIVCASGDPPGVPVGSPVKDSLATKVFPGASHFLGVVYGTTELYAPAALQDVVDGFAALLAAETGGTVVQARVVE